jgi:hypothetical protein
MPARHACRTVPSYIDALEWHFAEHGVTDDCEKIKATLRYLETRVEKSFSAYITRAKTWDDFKDELIELHPDAAEEEEATLADLESLVKARAASPITTLDELGKYQRQFKVLAHDLLRKHDGQLISKNAVNYAYLHGFAPGELRKTLIMRLILTDPHHDSELAYDRDKVFTEAVAILSGRRSTAFLPELSRIEPLTKQEGVSAGLQSAFKAVISDLDSHLASMGAKVSTYMSAPAPGISNVPLCNNGLPPSTQPNTTRNCYFCGGPCLIRNCPEVARYIQLGLILRGTDGRLVLPGGTYIPGNRNNPSMVMKDRVDEWHRTHPGQSTLIARDHTIPTGRMTYHVSAV